MDKIWKDGKEGKKKSIFKGLNTEVVGLPVLTPRTMDLGNARSTFLFNKWPAPDWR
jgi:hypothetical protein